MQLTIFSECYHSVVLDGVNMGCPCCGVHDCNNTLESVCNHFCAEHDKYNGECAIVSCLEAIKKVFKTCKLQDHPKIKLHYYECGKAMFQLKKNLDHVKISQTHDLSLGTELDNI